VEIFLNLYFFGEFFFYSDSVVLDLKTSLSKFVYISLFWLMGPVVRYKHSFTHSVIV